MPAWQQVGAQRYFIDGDLFVMELQGAVSLDEITELMAQQETLFALYDRVLTLSIARNVELPSADVRKFLAARGKRVEVDRLHVVIVTDSALLRTIIQLIARATAMISKAPLHNTFVGSEAEAWQWVEDQRRQFPPRRRQTGEDPAGAKPTGAGRPLPKAQ